MCYHTKIREVQPNLLNFVKSKIYSLHDAQDIVQNVNYILVNKEPDYDENKNFKAWAFRIADFQIKGYFSKSKRSKIVFSPMEDQNSFEDLNLTHCNCPASAIENKERAEIFRDEVRRRKRLLPKSQLKIINLYSDGLKYKDIAKALNMTISKVSAYKYRAIEKMKMKEV